VNLHEDANKRLAEQISKQLRQAIESHGISINQAANLLGVSRANLYNYIKGSRIPSPEKLARMASLWNLKFEFSGNTLGADKHEFHRSLNTATIGLLVNSMRNTLRIFLCHASEDKGNVRQLYTQLRDEGFQPWLDTEDILPGENWDQAIRQAVRNSDVVLVCLSSHAVQKTGYVQKEVAQALDVAEEKPESTIYIIPVLLGPCSVPDRIRKWQWVDLSSSNGYEKLLRSLKRQNSLGMTLQLWEPISAAG
jgi:transcriptional regulator with XRE-family HTH domain